MTRKILTTEGINRKGSNRDAKCPCCNGEFASINMYAVMCANRGNTDNSKNGYICKTCGDNNYRYSKKNTKEYGDKSYNADGFGIEWETNGTTLDARHMFCRFGYIPTSDSSLANNDLNGKAHKYISGDGGYSQYSCEYKSALMWGRKALTKQAAEFETFLNNGHIASDESCGTHTHISINKDNNMGDTIRWVRKYAENLFSPLENLMKSNPQKTAEFFGRDFTYYASPINYNSLYDHCNWINLSKDTDVEFRLNKFKNAKQFLKVVGFEYEILKYIVKAHSEGVKSRVIGEKIAEKLKKAWA